jgi:uncharacterized protein YecE (DUF72 family)
MYAGSYPDDELRRLADRISDWHAEGRRVLVYFNNDLGGHAIRNARALKELLSAQVGVAELVRDDSTEIRAQAQVRHLRGE